MYKNFDIYLKIMVKFMFSKSQNFTFIQEMGKDASQLKSFTFLLIIKRNFATKRIKFMDYGAKCFGMY